MARSLSLMVGVAVERGSDVESVDIMDSQLGSVGL